MVDKGGLVVVSHSNLGFCSPLCSHTELTVALTWLKVTAARHNDLNSLLKQWLPCGGELMGSA